MFWSLLLGLGLLEALSYTLYRNVVAFTKQKKYYSSAVDDSWHELYMLEQLKPEELIQWLEGTMCYNTTNPDQYRQYLHPSYQEIPRGNVLKWVSYMLYFKSLWQLDPAHLQRAEEVLQRIEQRLDFTFTPGFSKEIFFLKFGNNHIQTVYKPLLIQLFLWLVKFLLYSILWICGFRQYRSPHGILYWHYQHPEPEKINNRTVLFVHGIGFGSGPYFKFIMQLTHRANVLVPILPNISFVEYHSVFQNITHEALFPSYQTWRDDLKAVLRHFQILKPHVIAHSFGTIIVSSWLRDPELRERFQVQMLVDPACFLDRAYHTFKYLGEPYDLELPRWSHFMNRFIYQDVYVRYVAQRFMYGPEFWIRDFSELDRRKYLIILSEKDLVIPVKSLRNRLKKHGFRYGVVAGAKHGNVFYLECHQRVFQYLLTTFWQRVEQFEQRDLLRRDRSSRRLSVSSTPELFSHLSDVEPSAPEREEELPITGLITPEETVSTVGVLRNLFSY